MRHTTPPTAAVEEGVSRTRFWKASARFAKRRGCGHVSGDGRPGDWAGLMPGMCG